MIEFVTAGTPRAVSQLIEELAAAQHTVSAIVVPWESDGTTLSISVTAVTGDGWAIEHASLGTITLTDAGNDRTRVNADADEADHPDRAKRAALFDRFAREIQSRLQVAP